MVHEAGGEQHGEGREVGGLGEAVEGEVVQHDAFAVLVDKVLRHIGLDEAGGEDERGDAVFAEAPRNGTRQRDDARLRCRVGHIVRRVAAKSCPRGNVDQTSALPFSKVPDLPGGTAPRRRGG